MCSNVEIFFLEITMEGPCKHFGEGRVGLLRHCQEQKQWN